MKTKTRKESLNKAPSAPKGASPPKKGENVTGNGNDIALMGRDELENYIKEKIPFYRWADLCGHSDKELTEVIKRNKSR